MPSIGHPLQQRPKDPITFGQVAEKYRANPLAINRVVCPCLVLHVLDFPLLPSKLGHDDCVESWAGGLVDSSSQKLSDSIVTVVNLYVVPAAFHRQELGSNGMRKMRLSSILIPRHEPSFRKIGENGAEGQFEADVCRIQIRLNGNVFDEFAMNEVAKEALLVLIDLSFEKFDVCVSPHGRCGMVLG
jgi:hypothetical protein